MARPAKGDGSWPMCDALNLPLLTFVDTSGFYPVKISNGAA